MSENSEQNQTADEKNPGGTLDLNNISINTLKDDLAEENGETKEDKSGWLSFLAKHQKTETAPASPAQDNKDTLSASEAAAPSSEPAPETPFPASPEPAGDSLDQALDQFKTESQPKSAPSAAEAPPNLPISDGGASPVPETPEPEVPESPALGSFFPPKEETAEEPEDAPGLTHLAPPLKETSEIQDKIKVGSISPQTQ